MLRRLFFLVSALVLSFCLMACEEWFSEDKTPSTSLFVNLPTVADDAADGATLWDMDAVVRYVVTLAKDDFVVVRECEKGASMSLTNLSSGVYTLTVDGYNYLDEVIAHGGGTAELAYGTNTRIDVTMHLLANTTEYIVTYNLNADNSDDPIDLSDPLPESTTYAYKDTVTVVFPAMTRTGYDFSGWNTAADGSGTSFSAENGETSFTIEKEMVNGVTLYAQWIPYTYTVRFHANADDATGVMEDQHFTYDESQSLTKNQFARHDGYLFVGWSRTDGSGENEADPHYDFAAEIDYEDEGLLLNATAENEADVDLYARWVVKTNTPYIVRYWKQRLDATGTTGFASADYDLSADDTVELSGTTTTWTNAPDIGYKHFHLAAEDHTQTGTISSFQKRIAGVDSVADSAVTVVDVYYDRDYYTITFVGGTSGTEQVRNLPQNASYRYETAVPVPTEIPTCADWNFIGWTVNGGEKIYTPEDAVLVASLEKDVTVSAVWGQIHGIAVTVEPTADIALSYTLVDATTVVLSATEGFSEYRWELADEAVPVVISGGAAVSSGLVTAVSADGHTITLDTTQWARGSVHSIQVIAQDARGMFSATVQIRVEG